MTLLASTPARAELRIQDDADRTIKLKQPAQRIIALYGAFNEILAAMGLEDRIVARTKADDTPPSILAKPSIGTHMRPNVELVLGNAPDLVLQMAGRKQATEAVRALERFGVTTAVFSVHSFTELFSVIKRIGVLTGEQGKAEQLITSLKTRLEKVKVSLNNNGTRPKVFFEVRYPNLLAAAQHSIVTDIIHHAGAENCVKGPKKFLRLGEEELIRLNPDVYVLQKGPMNPTPVPLAQRPHFKTLRPVRQGLVFEVDEKQFSRPGPRNVDAVEHLAALLRSTHQEQATQNNTKGNTQ